MIESHTLKMMNTYFELTSILNIVDNSCDRSCIFKNSKHFIWIIGKSCYREKLNAEMSLAFAMKTNVDKIMVPSSKRSNEISIKINCYF